MFCHRQRNSSGSLVLVHVFRLKSCLPNHILDSRFSNSPSSLNKEMFCYSMNIEYLVNTSIVYNSLYEYMMYNHLVEENELILWIKKNVLLCMPGMFGSTLIIIMFNQILIRKCQKDKYLCKLNISLLRIPYLRLF